MSSAINKLVCSFKSDLPNEIDFAMQVATVLANSDNFIWSNDYTLVDAICSSLHVYSCVCQDDAPLASCYCYSRFWHKILDEKYINLEHIQAATLASDSEKSYLNFTKLKDHDTNDQNRIYKRILAVAELIKQFSMACDIKSSPPTATTVDDSEKSGEQQHPSNGFSYHQNQHQQQLLPSQQINQQPLNMQQINSQLSQNHTQPVSTLDQMNNANNLNTNNYTTPYNYTYSNKKKKLKASTSLMKFVTLLLVSKDMPLYMVGLDILSNTASKLAKLLESNPEDSNCGLSVQMFQQHCIDNICCPDGDICIIMRSLEVVSKLISSSNSRVSSAIIQLINGSGLLSRIEQLLTSRNDVNLFLATLECCYRISRHQPHLIAANRAQHMTKILVNLLDCDEKQFFTPQALKRIALIGDELSSGWTQLPPPKIFAQKTVDSKKIAPMNQKPAQDSVTTIPKSNHNNITTNNKTIPAKEVRTITNGTIIAKPCLTNGLPNGQTQIQSQPPTQPPIETQLLPQTQTAPQIRPQLQQSSQPQRSDQTQHSQLAQSSQPQQARDVQPTAPAQSQQQMQPPPTNTPTKEYTCEWNNCNAKFTAPRQVYTHVFEVHIGSLAQSELSPCQWTSPNGSGPGCQTKRPKYSLLTHLNDFHCSPAALERALTRSEPIKPPVHPGYGPNAALLAIRRHANSEKNGNKVSNSHSLLSVSVRLTAALILRNLATQSIEMKQALGNHEPLLSEICMTNGRDESKIIAECLSLFSSE